MPKEVKKRGRRADKKRKEEAAVAEVVQKLEEHIPGVVRKHVPQEEGHYGGGTLFGFSHQRYLANSIDL